jgi:hypothetical protein
MVRVSPSATAVCSLLLAPSRITPATVARALTIKVVVFSRHAARTDTGLFREVRPTIAAASPFGRRETTG